MTANDIAPTAQSYEVFKDLSAQLQVQLDQLNQMQTQDLVAFNKMVRDQDIPAVRMKGER